MPVSARPADATKPSTPLRGVAVCFPILFSRPLFCALTCSFLPTVTILCENARSLVPHTPAVIVWGGGSNSNGSSLNFRTAAHCCPCPRPPLPAQAFPSRQHIMAHGRFTIAVVLSACLARAALAQVRDRPLVIESSTAAARSKCTTRGAGSCTALASQCLWSCLRHSGVRSPPCTGVNQRAVHD